MLARPLGRLATALALALAAGAVGCSTGIDTDDPAIWADRVCTALVPLVQVNESRPAVNAADFAATKLSMSASLTAAADAMSRTLSGLDAAGTSPIGGGNEVLAKLKDLATEVRGTMLDAKIKLDAADPADSGAFIGALADAFSARATLAKKVEQAQQTMQANPEVKAAALKGASCPQVGLGGPPAVPPSSLAPPPTSR
jgi:hypothetical protein